MARDRWSDPTRAVSARGRVVRRPTASVSLDMDNLWSYMKTHGDPDWERSAQLPRRAGAADARRLRRAPASPPPSSSSVSDAAREDGAKAVAAIAAAGHEVGNHSFEHEPWLHTYERGRLEEELARTEEAIVAAGAPRPRGFRGPGYSLSPDAARAAGRARLHLRREHAARPGSVRWPAPTTSAPAHSHRGARAAVRAVRRPRPRGCARCTPTDGATAGTPAALLELPVTTVPLVRVPLHVSYLMHLHQMSPRAARGLLRERAAAVQAARCRTVAPAASARPARCGDAPRVGVLPGMAMPAAEKVAVVRYALRR